MSNSVSRRGFVAGAAGAGAMAVLAGLTACGGSKKDDTKKGAGDDSKATTKAKLEMVTDTGGVNDQSFNQLAWEGMQQLQKEEGWDGVCHIFSLDQDLTTRQRKGPSQGVEES